MVIIYVVQQIDWPFPDGLHIATAVRNDHLTKYFGKNSNRTMYIQAAEDNENSLNVFKHLFQDSCSSNTGIHAMSTTAVLENKLGKDETIDESRFIHRKWNLQVPTTVSYTTNYSCGDIYNVDSLTDSIQEIILSDNTDFSVNGIITELTPTQAKYKHIDNTLYKYNGTPVTLPIKSSYSMLVDNDLQDYSLADMNIINYIYYVKGEATDLSNNSNVFHINSINAALFNNDITLDCDKGYLNGFKIKSTTDNIIITPHCVKYGSCPAIESSSTSLAWPSTAYGNDATVKCESSKSQICSSESVIYTRHCDYVGNWEEPIMKKIENNDNELSSSNTVIIVIVIVFVVLILIIIIVKIKSRSNKTDQNKMLMMLAAMD